MGALIFDGFCDGILLYNHGNAITDEKVDETAFGILQAGRARTSKTEYISCPGCGRTLYDLEATIARIKAATSHLKAQDRYHGLYREWSRRDGPMPTMVMWVPDWTNQLYKGKECVLKQYPRGRRCRTFSSVNKRERGLVN